jgi:hypothetical protein
VGETTNNKRGGRAYETSLSKSLQFFSLSVLSLPLISGSHFQTAKNTRRNGEEVTGRPRLSSFPFAQMALTHKHYSSSARAPLGIWSTNKRIVCPSAHNAPGDCNCIKSSRRRRLFLPLRRQIARSLSRKLEYRHRVQMLHHGAGCTHSPLEFMCCTAHISAKCTRTENEWASALPTAVSLTLE